MLRSKRLPTAIRFCLGILLATALSVPAYAQEADPLFDQEVPSEADLEEFSPASAAPGPGADVIEIDGSETDDAEATPSEAEAAEPDVEAQDWDLPEEPAEWGPESEAAIPSGEDVEEPDVGLEFMPDYAVFIPAIQGNSLQAADEELAGALESAESEATAARTVRGDFNRDGFDDLAIGVPNEDMGTVSNVGIVQIIYGSEQGLAAKNQVWHQNSSGILQVSEKGDRFGWALAVGDFNGDGFDDLAIGVPYEDFGTTGVANRGIVQVLYGNKSGLSANGNQIWHQNSPGIANVAEAGDLFGRSLTSGDFNNDGRDDLAVGVPYEDLGTTGVTNQGVVQVLYGRNAGLSATGGQIWHQDSTGIVNVAEAGDLFGWSLTSGDFNNDSRDDLVIGVPYEDFGTPNVPNRGVVHVLYGRSSGLQVTGSQMWHQNIAGVREVAEAWDRFGHTLTAGDFNGDRRDDLAVGVPYENYGNSGSANRGVVQVFYGAANGLSANGDQVWSEDTAGVLGLGEADDQFGFSLASGDFNKDGRADLAIGVPLEDFGTTGSSNRGTVHILFGSYSGLTSIADQLWHQNVKGVRDVSEAEDQFGLLLKSGDFDGNMADDLCIGVPLEDLGSKATKIDAGAINVLYGVRGAGLTAVGDQFLHQDSASILEVAEAWDRFGQR